ncbi:MAG: PAC2 family protein [Actinobacteria bacterium]|nr:PAC2 family protein [Actinomycetota bacterium]
MPLFELHERPDLAAPVMIVALDGWIDAGLGTAGATTAILERTEMTTVATFDADNLLDHRARRPTMQLVDGVQTNLTWPSIELRVGTDTRGTEALFLLGAEPDHTWRAFSKGVADLALEFDVRLVTGLGAYPAPVPHTRPTRVVSTATTAELAREVGFVPGRIDVPGGVHAAIQHYCGEAGLPAVGLWAQVPHYAAAMPYPAAGAALIDALARHADLHFDATALRTEATATRARLDELVANSDEHVTMVQQLEQHVDAVEDAGAMTLLSGDELAAEVEKFLRDQ